MICTPSNYAIDEIVLRLLNKGLFDDKGKRFTPKIVRLGVMDKIKNPQVLSVCIKTLVNKALKEGQLEERLEKDRKMDLSDLDLKKKIDSYRDKIRVLRAAKETQKQADALRIERDSYVQEFVQRKRAKVRIKVSTISTPEG